MSVVLRILLIIFSLGTLVRMMKGIRRAKLQIENSIFWILFSILMIVIAIFPQLVYWAAGLVGIKSPANIVYLGIIFILVMKMFSQTLEISSLQYKVRELVEELALRDYEEKKEKQG